jgi:hypothetical protein
MIRQSLEIFVDAAIKSGTISADDVRHLQRDIMTDGIESRDECDVLIALDRAVVDKAGAWSAFVVQSVVDYVVWTSRPTGMIDHDMALWLTTSLGAGSGPTHVAVAIAFEAVRECDRADQMLVSFVMRWARGRAIELRDELKLDLAA